MYAIIETGGKQYKVAEGDIIKVEKLAANPGDTVLLDKVLLVGKEDGVVAGTPTVAGAKAVAKVLEQGRRKKIIVFKYKAKANYRRKRGHRQPYTELTIEKIEL